VKKAKIIFLIVIICLGVIGLTSCNYNYYSSWTNYKDYAVSSGNFQPDEVSSVTIDWISGSIEIMEADVETVTVYEESNTTLKENEKLRLLVKNGILDIRFASPGLKLSKLTLTKTLYVQIPKILAKNIALIDIDAVSSDINIKNIKSTKMDIESVSGNIVFDTCEATNVEISSVSGKIDVLTNKIANLDIESVSGKIIVANSEITDIEADITSGDIEFTSIIMPSAIDIDAVSSKVTLKLPQNSGFAVDYSTVSGVFLSNFETTSQGKGEFTYGDGKVSIKVSTISGNLSINKL
jgi:hypothetical protein